MKTQKIMTTQEVATRLVELMQAGKIKQAQKELYADNVISIQPPYDAEESIKGKAAVLKKSKEFAAMIKTPYNNSFSKALVASDCFSCCVTLNIIVKGCPAILLMNSFSFR